MAYFITKPKWSGQGRRPYGSAIRRREFDDCVKNNFMAIPIFMTIKNETWENRSKHNLMVQTNMITYMPTSEIGTKKIKIDFYKTSGREKIGGISKIKSFSGSSGLMYGRVCTMNCYLFIINRTGARYGEIIND